MKFSELSFTASLAVVMSALAPPWLARFVTDLYHLVCKHNDRDKTVV